MFTFVDFPKAATMLLLALTFLMFVARPLATELAPESPDIAASESARTQTSAQFAGRVSEIPAALPN